MPYANVDPCISLSDFDIILFLGKLLHKLKNFSQLLLIWKSPTQYTEGKIRMSLSIWITVKVLHLRCCHLNNRKVLKLEKNYVICFLCYRCLLLTCSLFHGILWKRISWSWANWKQRKLVGDLVFLDFFPSFVPKVQSWTGSWWK